MCRVTLGNPSLSMEYHRRGKNNYYPEFINVYLVQINIWGFFFIESAFIRG